MTKPPRAPQIVHGDCLEIMKMLPDNSVDSIVTDPPYGLSSTSPQRVTEAIVAWASGDREFIPEGKGFMGKSWDAFVPPPALWDEAMRVLKPGGHVLAFAGTRTQDLMGLSIRLAGFEIRDSVAWLAGSGFPKSHNVEKSTGDAKWAGWGTALKPAHEPIIMARKPLAGKTVAANVQAHGTGALNIDACRIGDGSDKDDERWYKWQRGDSILADAKGMNTPGRVAPRPAAQQGRWPANVALDEHMAAVLDAQSGVTKGRVGMTQQSSARAILGAINSANPTGGQGEADEGGASRFFYVAKAPKKERPVVDGVAHATVKPLALMRWLVRLVTPEGGTVLEPFAGSGTTVEACILEGVHCIAIEREAEYLPLIQARIDRQEAA